MGSPMRLVEVIAMNNIVREIRKEKKLSQDDLAKRTGLSRKTISNIENELSSPSFETASKIADALSVPVAQVFFQPPETPAVQ